MAAFSCDTCVFYVYDDETDQLYCDVEADEDDMARMFGDQNAVCPYYRSNDDYEIVRHQN